MKQVWATNRCILFRCVRISMRGLVRRSVRQSVCWSVGNAFVKIDEQDPEVNDASLSHFFIFHFFYNFFIFSLSSSLLPPRPSFLLVPPSSSLFLPLSKTFRIHDSPFFIDFDESIMDGRTDGPINGPMDKASYRNADASENNANLLDSFTFYSWRSRGSTSGQVLWKVMAASGQVFF